MSGMYTCICLPSSVLPEALTQRDDTDMLNLSLALTLYYGCIDALPQGILKIWRMRCNAKWPVRSEFVAMATSDTTTSYDAISKRIAKVESELPSLNQSPKKLATEPKVASKPELAVPHSPPQRTHPSHPGAPGTEEENGSGPSKAGRVDVRVNLDKHMAVTGSRQLQSSDSVCSSLLTVGVQQDMPLAKTHISVRSPFWHFHEYTRFMVYSEGALVAEACAEAVDFINTKGESDPEASGERELFTLHFDFPIESFRKAGILYGGECELCNYPKPKSNALPLTFSLTAVTEVVQILRFHIKSVLLNELLFKTGAGLNQYPYAVESLRITYSFENGVHGGEVCLPRLEELSPEPYRTYSLTIFCSSMLSYTWDAGAEIYMSNVPQPRHSPVVNQHTIPATTPASETHVPCTIASSGGIHPPLNPENRPDESTETHIPPTRPNVLYSTSPGSHHLNYSSILFQPLPATPPAAPPSSHSPGAPRHSTHVLQFISTSIVTAGGRYAPYPSPQPSGRMKCATLPSRKVAHPRTRTPTLPTIEPLGHIGAVDGGIGSGVNVGLMAPPPLPVAPRLPCRGLPHSKQPNITFASSFQQMGQMLVDRALLTSSESRSAGWYSNIGPAAPVGEFKFRPIGSSTSSAQGSNLDTDMDR